MYPLQSTTIEAGLGAADPWMTADLNPRRDPSVVSMMRHRLPNRSAGKAKPWT
jgi:hypothetical protein